MNNLELSTTTQNKQTTHGKTRGGVTAEEEGSKNYRGKKRDENPKKTKSIGKYIGIYRITMS